MTINSSTIDSSDLKLNLTDSGNVDTSSIKREHNSSPLRFENLRGILNLWEVSEKLQERWITIEENGDFCFDISTWANETVSVQVRNIGDFYQMLRKHKDRFFWDDFDESTFWDENQYELNINETDAADSILFWMFLQEYTWGKYYNEFETERGKINDYREERLKAIEDTLSHSWEFISGRNARQYGENPFYDMIKENPVLKRKSILLADKCWSNPMFWEFVKKHVSAWSTFIYFLEFVWELDESAMDAFAALFQSKKFASVFDNIFHRLPGAKGDLNRITTLLKDKENLGNIISFFYGLNDIWVKNTKTFLSYAWLRWEKYVVSWNSDFLDHFNSFDGFGKHYVSMLCELKILSDAMVVRIIKNWNEQMAMNIYIYMVEQADSYDTFLAKLWMVFQDTKKLQHIVWLESTNIEAELALIERKPKHVVDKLNEWKNPIAVKKFWREKYLDLKDAA